MYSASDWGGGSWKSGHSKGGCVNIVLQISSNCGQGGGGRGSKNMNISQMSLMKNLVQAFSFNMNCLDFFPKNEE